MLDRTDRSLVGIWWWTVDKWLLASALLLMTLGMILVMAASPAVANLINLSSSAFHRAPDYLSCACADDHAVRFNAGTKAYSSIISCWTNCGNWPDAFSDCHRQRN